MLLVSSCGTNRKHSLKVATEDNENFALVGASINFLSGLFDSVFIAAIITDPQSPNSHYKNPAGRKVQAFTLIIIIHCAF